MALGTTLDFNDGIPELHQSFEVSAGDHRRRYFLFALLSEVQGSARPSFSDQLFWETDKGSDQN